MDEFLQCGALISLSPSEVLIGYGKRTWTTEPSSVSFYFPDFFLTEKKCWFTHERQEVVSLSAFTLPEAEGAEYHWENPCFDLFASEFRRFKEQNLLEKAVPYVFAFAKGSAKLSWCLSHLLRYSQRHPVFAYGFWDAEETLLGATPERLFSLENERVESVALAATTRTGSFGPKEHREHALVIQGIEQSLFPFGRVEIGKTEARSFSTLQHLATPISLNATPLKGTRGFNQLVHALHPTPALGAYPKAAGKEWLEHYQTILPRRRFGAPVGYWRENGGQCYVAIRNVQRQGDLWQIGAGCGIVQESELEKEWSELNWKIDATRKILGV